MGALELTEVHGPSAFGGDRRRFRELLWIVSVADFRKTYANTALGFLWTIVRPLVFFGVIFLALREIFRFGGNIEDFGQRLVLGLVLFTFFSDTTTRCLRSVPQKEAMVRKMQFPRIVIPLSITLASTFTLLLNLLSVLPLFIITGVGPYAEWLLLLPVLVLLIVFSSGLGMLLSVLFVRYEDVGQIWTLTSRILFYATPVLYPVSLLDPPLSDIVSLNPLALLIEQARVYVIDPGGAGAADVAGPVVGVLIPMILIAITPLLGLWIFSREAPRVAEAL